VGDGGWATRGSGEQHLVDDAAAGAPETEVELRGGGGQEVVPAVRHTSRGVARRGREAAYTSLLVSTASARSALPPLNCLVALS
jgi:hypothetical protein